MNTAAAASQPDPGLKSLVDAVVVRLADEGIPVRAIARATHLPSDEVYEALRIAISQGFIVEMPRDDWPAGSLRGTRSPFSGTHLDNEEALRCACTRYFKASPLEAGMLALMLRRDEVTKEQLHNVIEMCRASDKDPTEIKMVDVMICKLRKKLRLHDIEVKTMWGLGYFIPRTSRDRAIAMLLEMHGE